MDTMYPDELFEVAVQLRSGPRKTLLDLLEKEQPVVYLRLEKRLNRFESFQNMLDKPNALAGLLSNLDTDRVKGDPTPALDGGLKNRSIGPMALPDRIGPYRVDDEISRGGQGTVFLASQEATGRMVAIKVIHGGSFHHPDDFSRFQNEIQSLAMMNHPHIAAIYEADTTEDGLPYFSMEYVDGQDIATFCQTMLIRQRIELALQMFDGIAHAHQRLILHRDLKPANVLVTMIDGRPVVKIVDFGIARSLELEQPGELTSMGMVGTLAFMPPEAFSGAKPDVRLDLYALGVMLYAMLTGRLPIMPPKELPFDQKVRYFREQEPVRPSRYLQNFKDRDLDAIVLRAMAKNPERRYASAADLARDCRLWLEGRPVSARVPSRFDWFRKLVARNKLLSAISFLLAIALIIGMTATMIAERRAQRESRRFQASFDQLRNILAAPDPHNMGVGARVIDVLRVSEVDFEANESLFADAALAAQIRQVWGQSYYQLGYYDDAKKHFEVIQAELNRQTGTRDPQLLDAQRMLAMIALKQGLHEEAETRMLAVYNQYPPVGFEAQKLQVLAGLVDTYQAMNHVERAKPWLQEMQDYVTKVRDPVERGRGLLTLGNIYNGIRDERAESMYRSAFRALKQESETNPLTLAAMGSLANVLRHKSQFEESESLYHRLIALRQQSLGENHDHTLYARAGLAMCLADQGKYQEAEETMRSVTGNLQRRKAVHPETYAMIRRLANIQTRGGNLQDAENLYRYLYEQYTEQNLLMAPSALMARSNLCDVLNKLGRPEEAIVLLSPLVADSKSVYGELHTKTVVVELTLGETLSTMGDYQSAEESFRDVIQRVATNRPDDSLLPYYRAIRADNLGKMGKLDDAERMLLKSLEAYDPKNIYAREIRKYLAKHYRLRGNSEKAVSYEKEGLGEKK